MLAVSRLIFAAMLVPAVVVATAAQRSYECKVEHVYDVAANGSIKVSGFEPTIKGGVFLASRVSGEIIGEAIPTLLATSTRVINQGSSANSFKAIAEFDGQIQVLEVQEFIAGSEKPFVALSMGGAGIITGICK